MDSEDYLRVRPMGIVRNDFVDEIPKGYEDMISEIVVNEDLSEGLFEIERNSHILVVFWLHKVDERKQKKLKIHPKGRTDMPLVGMFATRTPHRYNPIGIRAVKLLERKENILKVQGLDAFDQSPVIDIKPYSLKHDRIENAQFPEWVARLHDNSK